MSPTGDKYSSIVQPCSQSLRSPFSLSVLCYLKQGANETLFALFQAAFVLGYYTSSLSPTPSVHCESFSSESIRTRIS